MHATRETAASRTFSAPREQRSVRRNLHATGDRQSLRRIWRIVLALSVLDAVSCSSPAAPTTPPSSIPSGSRPNGVLVGAGDIGYCGRPGVEATARLLDSIEGTVFTTGDHAYMNGTAEEFHP